MTIFKAIEMEHYKDEPLQYVGIYILRWRPEWGEPTVGFVEDDSTEERIARLEAVAEAAQKAEKELRRKLRDGETLHELRYRAQQILTTALAALDGVK